MCIFLGTPRLHRFYMRRKGSGLAMLLIIVLTRDHAEPRPRQHRNPGQTRINLS
jgi:hypothetical protein